MTGRGWGLLGGGALTLLLAAWVSATGPVAVFARKDLTGYQAPAPGVDLGQPAIDQVEGRRTSTYGLAQEQPLLTAIISWVGKVVVALIVLALLVAAARALRQWWLAREQPADEPPDAVVVPDVLLRGAREGEELLASGTPANAVVAAWVALESAARSVGVRDDATRTSEELVTAVLRSYSVDRAPLDALAALYREARFSTHAVGEDMRTSAREALQQVQVELRRGTPRGRAAGGSSPAPVTGRAR